MSKRVVQYQGYHTHPCKDSTAIMGDDGTILVTHRIDLRQGYILTALKALGSATVIDIVDKLNKTFANGGYGVNHVAHALKRLRNDYGAVECAGTTWTLTSNARAKFENVSKKVRKAR